MKSILIGLLTIILPLQTYAFFDNNNAMLLFEVNDDKPAQQWQYAYPVGNGRLGAMPFADYPNDQILLNEETIWQGRNSLQNSMESIFIIEKVRELLWKNDYKKAQAMVANDFLSKELTPRSYQPLGFLKLKYENSPNSKLKDYRRSLSMNDGIAQAEFKTTDGHHISQQVFSSYPDNVIVVRIESLNGKPISMNVGMDRFASFSTYTIGDNVIAIRGQAMNENIKESQNNDTFSTGENRGVCFHGAAKILTDGLTKANSNEVRIENAQTITLLIASSTDYNYDNPYLTLRHDREKVCLDVISNAEKFTYDQLKQRHVNDHKPYIERAAVDLGTTDKSVLKKSTAQRLELVKQGADDPDLIEDLFQMGRYMLIASSRKGTLPPNLTGIWNADPAPACDSDWHTNINIQQNYWHAELTNLSDLHEPFFTLIDDMRLDQGKQMASKLGCRGFVISHATHGWKQSVFSGHPFWGMWPMGGAWSAAHLMEHYRFTNDKSFLKDTAYAILKDNALFCLDWLVENPKTGELVSGPSTSPENGFYVDNSKDIINVCMGPEMDHQIIYESFANFLEASELLGVSDELTSQISKAISRISKTKIAPDGRIMEWDKNYREYEVNHRHYSHLYALHPGNKITPKTPELFEAARKSVEVRQTNGGVWQGWSRAWLVNLYARLYEPQKAYSTILYLLKNNTLPNLMHTQPPIFFDGNGAGTAGVVEMLLQSQGDAIHLLPCLPIEWTNGSFNGLCTRGAFEIDLKWNSGKPIKAQVLSKAGNQFRLYIDSDIQVYNNGVQIKTQKTDDYIAFDTHKGERYIIIF